MSFGTLANYQGNFKSSSKRRYLGMMGIYKQYNRALIPETGSVFFLKAYLPTLIALDIKEKFTKLTENDISERIEAFCCWYSLEKGSSGKNSKRVKGKKKFQQLIKQKKYSFSARELRKEYTETTFRQSCVRSLKNLGFRDGHDTSLTDSQLTEDGKKFLVGYFSNEKELKDVKQLLVDWLKDNLTFSELLKSELFKKDITALNFYEDAPERTLTALNKQIEHIDPAIFNLFDKLPHETEKDVLNWLTNFEQFIADPDAPDLLKKKAKYINSFFKFHRSCVLLSDLLEKEIAEKQSFVISDWANKNKTLIHFCRNCAKDFLQKKSEREKSKNAEDIDRQICVLASDIKGACNNEEVLVHILRSNEKQEVLFSIQSDGVVTGKGVSDKSIKSFDPQMQMRRIKTVVCIPQVWNFAVLQWPWLEEKLLETKRKQGIEEPESDDE